MPNHIYPNPYPIEIFACGVNQELARQVAKILGLDLSSPEPKVFSNGEFLDHQKISVRFRDVFVICQPRQGDKYHLSYDMDECYSLVFALWQGSPASITVVLPYLPYSRQDRSTNHREPVLSAKIGIALQAYGADKLVVLKLHSPSSYNAHPKTIRMELVETDDLIVNHIKSKNFNLKKFKVVAPDASAANYARFISDRLGIENEIVIVDKSRNHKSANEAKALKVIGNPRGYNFFMIDDMGDTFNTAKKANFVLKEKGAKDGYFISTHGILSGKALENIKEADFAGIWITDTCYISPEKASKIPNLEIIPTAIRIADVIRNLHDGKSVTNLWQPEKN